MNPDPDPFEERLRALRPATLPEELRERLAEPPSAAAADDATRDPSQRVFKLFLSFVTAAAACVTYLFSHRSPAPVAPVPPPPASIVASSTSRVLEVRPLSTLTDESDRTWRFIEITWVDEDTVTTPAATIIQAQEPLRTVIPVPVHFD